MLTSPGSPPQPAQAQTTAPKIVLSIDGTTIASFSKMDEAVSSIRVSESAAGTSVAQRPSIVLERNANGSLELSSWHQAARVQSSGYRRSDTLTFFDSSGEPTLKLFLENAWPTEYRLEQRGARVAEGVMLTADSFQRVSS